MSIKDPLGILNTIDLHTLATVSSDSQSTGVDISNYKGVARIIACVESVSGTTPTLDITLQQSSDNGSADAYTDVTGGAFTQVTTTDTSVEIDIDLDALEEYVRLDFDVGGTSPVYKVAAVMITRSATN